MSTTQRQKLNTSHVDQQKMRRANMIEIDRRVAWPKWWWCDEVLGRCRFVRIALSLSYILYLDTVIYHSVCVFSSCAIFWLRKKKQHKIASTRKVEDSRAPTPPPSPSPPRLFSTPTLKIALWFHSHSPLPSTLSHWLLLLLSQTFGLLVKSIIIFANGELQV